MTMGNPIVVLGAGPAGMAAALALRANGHDVRLLERYPEARPAGTLLNLWPPPIKALADMGVDVDDLGAPCHSSFRSAKGRVRADVRLPDDVIAKYRGGFIGMLRPDLYRRLLAALGEGMPETGKSVVRIHDEDALVRVDLEDGEVIYTPLLVGSDGIDSMVRKHLWGDSPKREHKLHVFGGYTFDTSTSAIPGECVLSHSRKVQGTYSSIRSNGQSGFQWWILEAWDPDSPAPSDLHARATALAEEFGDPLRELVRVTSPEHMQRWLIRDREPLTAWSKGRITLSGDAAHPTSPYAAYGAGMSICDGYQLARALVGIDLSDTAAVRGALVSYESARIPHTTDQVQQAFFLGRVFHHAPAPLRPLRDFVFDHTPFLQKMVGDRSPQEIVTQLAEMGESIKVPLRH
jgi:2-polyprenyl-6-methoxyphenol hydroxylase-like FAD-dependent oxidoreductase